MFYVSFNSLPRITQISMNAKKWAFWDNSEAKTIVAFDAGAEARIWEIGENLGDRSKNGQPLEIVDFVWPTVAS